MSVLLKLRLVVVVFFLSTATSLMATESTQELASTEQLKTEQLKTEQLKIVSLVPSLTNIVTSLGAGSQLVAVSNYCSLEENSKTPRVGGLFNINYEAIYSLKPDLVLLLSTHAGAKNSFEKLGIKTLSVENESVKEIIRSLHLVGKAIHREEQASHLIGRIENQLSDIKIKTNSANKKRALIVIDSSTSGDTLVSATLATKNSIFGDILNSLGHENALSSSIKYPKVSRETISDLEFDTVYLLLTEKNHSQTIASWRKVVGEKLKVIQNDSILTPGANLAEIIEFFNSTS